MNTNLLSISCDEWRSVADSFPVEMEVIVEMLIEAEAELCKDLL